MNLTFAEIYTENTPLAPVSTTISNFSYGSTATIVVDNIPDLHALVEEQDGGFVEMNVQYLLVEIYSYSLITQVYVLHM